MIRRFMIASDAKKVREIKRLMYAAQSMTLAIESCQIARLNPEASLNFFNVIGLSICTLYASPFTEGNGLGSLSSTYTKFPDFVQKGMHDDLIKARNQIFAHRDLIANPNNIHDIEIRIMPNKQLHVHTPLAGYLPEDYSQIAVLCAFQKSRMDRAAEVLLFDLQKRHDKPVGRYVLGVTFP